MSGVTMHDVQETNAREFIQHPIGIPIEYCFVDIPYDMLNTIQDINQGGLSFWSQKHIEPNCWLHLHIPIDGSFFEIDAQVCWCKLHGDNGYDVGVHFTDQNSAFSARMVEQICHIEQYKLNALNNEGRQLSGDEAAAEWIEKFANQFPQNL